MLLKSASIVAAFVVSLCIIGVGQAQQPNPLDAVPEKVPFDVPYGAAISLDRADAVLAAAVAESKKRDWKMVCARG